MSVNINYEGRFGARDGYWVDFSSHEAAPLFWRSQSGEKPTQTRGEVPERTSMPFDQRRRFIM